jgi:hypothetical protein
VMRIVLYRRFMAAFWSSLTPKGKMWSSSHNNEQFVQKIRGIGGIWMSLYLEREIVIGATTIGTTTID